MAEPPLGLPPVPIPADNPQTPEKIALGDKLFHDKRFSSTGQVSCATCHDAQEGLHRQPAARRREGINKLTGTRNAPTVVNAAYYHIACSGTAARPTWRTSRSIPFVNPVEMGLPDHEPILDDRARRSGVRRAASREVFGKTGADVTMERRHAGDRRLRAHADLRRLALRPLVLRRRRDGADRRAEARLRRSSSAKARCVSCHVIEQTQALFTDNRFHNIGVGINQHPERRAALARRVPRRRRRRGARRRQDGAHRQEDLRTRPLRGDRHARSTSAPSRRSTLRNIAVTAPYMHDGSLEDAARRRRALQQRRRDQGRRPGQRLPVRRHPPAGSDGPADRRPGRLPGGADQPCVRSRSRDRRKRDRSVAQR